MGREYLLDVEVPNRAEADRVLRSVRGFEGYDAEFELYTFRRVSTGAMPDASAKIERDGIYVCDNGGESLVEDIAAAFAAIGPRAEPREI